MDQNKKCMLGLGVGVLACLLVLTIVSVLDLRRDTGTSTWGPPGNVSHVQGAALCYSCGTRSIPQCLYCGTIMKWDAGLGSHYCPGCRRISHAYCPNCGLAMGHPAAGRGPVQAGAVGWGLGGYPIPARPIMPRPVVWGTGAGQRGAGSPPCPNCGGLHYPGCPVVVPPLAPQVVPQIVPQAVPAPVGWGAGQVQRFVPQR